MGIRGEYVLKLTCDNDSCWTVAATATTYKGADNKSTVAAARVGGWRISSTSACCPACVRGEQKGTRCKGS